MGDPHRAEISDILSTFNTGSTASGSFHFTEGQMEKIINNWLDLAASYEKSLTNARHMSRIKPPAKDFASEWHALAANRSGVAYARYLVRQRDYCLEQAQKSLNTLNDYLGVEHTNVVELMKAGRQSPQDGV